MPEQQAHAAEAGDLNACPHQAAACRQVLPGTEIGRVVIDTAVEKSDSRKTFALSVAGSALGRFIVEVALKVWERLI